MAAPKCCLGMRKHCNSKQNHYHFYAIKL